MQETLKPIRGFFHLQIVDEDGTIAGEAEGENVITDIGFRDYILKPLQGIAGSAVNYMALGTYSVNRSFSASDSRIDNIVSTKTAVGATATSNVAGSRTASFFGTFVSNFAGASIACINEIGLFHTVTSNCDAFALASFASSSVAANQAINLSYNIVFASST